MFMRNTEPWTCCASLRSGQPTRNLERLPGRRFSSPPGKGETERGSKRPSFVGGPSGPIGVRWLPTVVGPEGPPTVAGRSPWRPPSLPLRPRGWALWTGLVGTPNPGPVALRCAQGNLRETSNGSPGAGFHLPLARGRPRGGQASGVRRPTSDRSQRTPNHGRVALHCAQGNLRRIRYPDCPASFSSNTCWAGCACSPGAGFAS
jgi:hypothetical protein